MTSQCDGATCGLCLGERTLHPAIPFCLRCVFDPQGISSRLSRHTNRKEVKHEISRQRTKTKASP